LHKMVNEHVDEIDPREVNSIPIGSDGDGTDVVVRVGKFGPYLQRGEETASIPEDIPPDELTIPMAIELLTAPSQDRTLGSHPETGDPVYLKNGRFGPYIQMGEMDDGKDKPPTASLFKDMDPTSVTLDDALLLLSLPRVVGTDDDGEEILALNGRYGPYIKKGKETRSLDTERQILSVTLDEAKALLAEPKKGRRGAATVLKELGEDPETGAAMTIKDGRYGPYVTDGTTNASIPRGDSPEEVTPERGSQLLAERRAKGPAKRKKTSKKKKTTRKKTTKKKSSSAKKKA